MHFSFATPFSKVTMNTEYLDTGYSSGKSKRIVSSGLNLNIRNGEFIALIGTNGCGKSTLMRTVCGLQRVMSGSVAINGEDIGHLSPKQLSKLFSLVLTESIDAANLTVNDVIAIGRYPYVGFRGKLRQSDMEVMQAAVERCSLKGFEERYFSELSDGEKQRVMLAKALVQDTPLILLDEPTSHLDIPNRIDMMKMLHVLTKQTNKSVIMSTHELDLALQWADTIWLMDKNGNIQAGVPEDLILSNSFSGVFDSEQASFDIYSGVFKMNRTPLYSIELEATEPYRFWLYRALSRYGFHVTTGNEAEYKISVKDSIISLQTTNNTLQFHSIAELLGYLLNNDYWNSFGKEIVVKE